MTFEEWKEAFYEVLERKYVLYDRVYDEYCARCFQFNDTPLEAAEHFAEKYDLIDFNDGFNNPAHFVWENPNITTKPM